MSEDTIAEVTAAEDAEAEPTPAQLAELAASAAQLAEAAAEHAASAADAAVGHRDRTFAYAARAEEAKQRADALIAADAASAADAQAARARRALADAERHLDFATRHRRIIDRAEGDHDTELATANAAIDRATDAAQTARQALTDADAAARTAGEGVDWLRYHLELHCRHSKDRVAPLTDEELAAAAPAPF